MDKKPLFIAGPCVIESAELLDTVAATLADINRRLGVEIIFKASFDKANRTSISSFRGPGLEKGLRMLADVRSKWGLRLLTDIHESCQAAPVGEVVDVIQIPAFLCRPFSGILSARKITPYRTFFHRFIPISEKGQLHYVVVLFLILLHFRLFY